MTKTPEEFLAEAEQAKAALKQRLSESPLPSTVKRIREECVAELAELLVVIEKEDWEHRPQKRAVLAGIKLAIRELMGQKRPRE